jgi:signal peptidase I
VGDVVVLQHPDRAGTVCKRVLGLPGDIVTKPSSRRGAEQFLKETEQTQSKPSFLPPQQSNITVLKRRRSAAVLEVPEGHIWVEGDNPWNSTDSRNYGPLPASLIVGRVFCRIWPLRGNARIERGDRPIQLDEQEKSSRPSLAFSGSVVFPAGYIDQTIIRDYRQWTEQQMRCVPEGKVE